MQIPQLDPIRPARPFPLRSSRFDGSTGPRIIGPRDGKFVNLQSVGVRFMIWGAETGETFSLVEHPIPPHTLVAPLHGHLREDEYSYVLEGRMGAARRRRGVRRGGRPRLQAAEPVAHVLERRRYPLPAPGDHLARGLRALLQRAGRADGRGEGGERVGGARPRRTRRSLRPLLPAGEHRAALSAARPGVPGASPRVSAAQTQPKGGIHVCPPKRPSKSLEAVVEGINTGNFETLMALYEPEAAFAAQPGRLAPGLGGIRDALGGDGELLRRRRARGWESPPCSQYP
jgi:hypothetical protein